MPNLTVCPHCRHVVSTSATFCPSCGVVFYQRTPEEQAAYEKACKAHNIRLAKFVAILVVVSMVVGLLISMMSGPSYRAVSP